MSRLAECRLDSLEELELGLTDGDPNTSESPALTMAPRLRKSNITMQSDKPHMLVPWPQLTHLTLDCESPDSILGIIAHCTTLIHASLCTSGWYFDAPMAQSTATRPLLALRTLSLLVGRPEHMTQFVDALSAPALEELYLDFMRMHWQGTMQAASLARFLIRSPNITRFDLRRSWALTSHELIVVFGHTPRLAHLRLAHLRGRSLDDTLLHALSYKDGVAPLVPHLHHLVLIDIEEDGFAGDALEHMFVSRWWTDAEITSSPPAVARWSHLELELRDRYSEEFMESMERLQRKGLLIRNA
ncbi:hypothetical protein C8R45DRAFT_1020879 [Mycena sanguinolenta]|nr:hypothetical protein C8R45DRAFT_1020879 [Mycena sanguinolenta]